MIRFSRLPLLVLCCIALTISCTKPVTIGSDFLQDEKSDLKFLDDFDLIFKTEKTDSILTHSDNISLQLTTYMIGHVQDPVFGTYTADIYCQPAITTVATQLLNATLDSVVLLLKYDTSVYYGQISDPVTLEVYKMLENPDFDAEYYSDQQFMTSTELLGSATFIPAPTDSVTVIVDDDTTRTAPHIRVALDKLKFGEFLTQDSVVYENVDSFLHFFNGLNIRMTGATNTMLGLDLLSTLSGLTLYYDKGTTENQVFKFLFGTTVKSVYMHHDYTGSVVEAALGPDVESEYWYVQGLSGVTTSLQVDGLDALGAAVINNAELEVYCTFPDGDMPAFYPPVPYLITQEKTDTSLIPSIDVRNALSLTSGSYRNSTYETLFGGFLSDTVPGPPPVYRYNMRVTNQIKEIFKGTGENIIYFNPILKGNIPNRTVFFGPNHPVYAPRLRIYYTAL